MRLIALTHRDFKLHMYLKCMQNEEDRVTKGSIVGSEALIGGQPANYPTIVNFIRYPFRIG